jgi:hypothetical protein
MAQSILNYLSQLYTHTGSRPPLLSHVGSAMEWSGSGWESNPPEIRFTDPTTGLKPAAATRRTDTPDLFRTDTQQARKDVSAFICNEELSLQAGNERIDQSLILVRHDRSQINHHSASLQTSDDRRRSGSQTLGYYAFGSISAAQGHGDTF